MSACLTRGVLTISIDLDADKPLADVAGSLLDLLRRHHLPATWAVNDPAAWAAVGQVLSASPHQEVAILADASWVGGQVPRSRFSRELAGRVARAQAAGLTITTLALDGVQLEDRSDLAIKHGMGAVRHPRYADDSSPRSLQPRTLQFGLWSFPVALVLPAGSRWLPGGGGGRAARSLVDQAIRAKGLVQLVIDAPRLARRGRSSLRVVERVLRHVEDRRQQGVLDVANIATVAARLASQQQGQPSRSILRPAA